MIRKTILTLFIMAGLIAAGTAMARAQDSGATTANSPGEKSGQGAQGVMREKREALRAELQNLPPDQRKARLQQLKQSMSQDRQQKLQQRQQQFQEKWNTATPEQRAKFCSNVKQKCSSGGGKFACQVAQAKCAGQ